MTTPAYRLIFSLGLFASTAMPLPVTAASEEEVNGEYQQLLGLLEEQTSIATKTRLNADYVPGIVTVLHGKDMAANGSRTVWEALAKVPGIELSIEETGRKQIVVRGIGRTYASGNVKILLNGLSMNSAQIAYANPVYNIPIEQVERIEVIRGPGSAIHGEYAYTGVINVITRDEGQHAYLRAAEGNHRGAGGLYSYRDEKKDLSVSLNVGHWQEDGVEVTAGNDKYYFYGTPEYSNAPGPTNEAQEDTTAVFALKKNDYRMTLQWMQDGSGDHFGINELLPPDEKKIVTRYRNQSIELGKEFSDSEHIKADIHTAWLRSEEIKDGLFIDNAAAWGLSGAPVVVDTSYREERISAGVELQWLGWQEHQLLLAYEHSKTQTQLNDNSYGQEGDVMTPFAGIIATDTERAINSLTLQDEYQPSTSLTITLGLRHDDYSDVGSSTTPRLAAVYRLNRMHIIKAQYARAFRPPTFYELGGKIDTIAPSTIETYEAGYIFKGLENDVKITLFHSNLNNPIVFIDTTSEQGYDNTAGASLYGAELEWEYDYSHNLELISNLSYLKTEDDSTAEPFAGSSDWLANIGINYRPSSMTLLNMQYRYTGDVYRSLDDTRDALDAYNTLDVTYSLFNVMDKGHTLRIGVKNALDENVVYPAPSNTYPDDRPRPGRYWWAALGFQF